MIKLFHKDKGNKIHSIKFTCKENAKKLEARLLKLGKTSIIVNS